MAVTDPMPEWVRISRRRDSSGSPTVSAAIVADFFQLCADLFQAA